MQSQCSSKRGTPETVALLFVAAICALCTPASATVSVSLHPRASCVEYNGFVTMELRIDEAAEAFDAYEAVLRFDPGVLDFVSAQEGPLMLNVCGNTWWRCWAGEDSVFISHVVMCGGATVTGPGTLSSIVFQASQSVAQSELSFDYITFWVAGEIVPNVSHGGVVLVRDTCTPPAVCCIDESCSITLEGECLDSGGSWHGDWTSCEDDPCVDSGIDSPPLWTRSLMLSARPNPFVGRTTLQCTLPAGIRSTLEVLDAAGRRVRTFVHYSGKAGVCNLDWDGCNESGARVASGLYIARLRSGDLTTSQRLVLIR